MASVNPASSGVSTLLQMLSAVSPQLSSLLSAPNIQSALKSSPVDLAHLSSEAMQLQQVNVLFGSLDGTQTSGSTPFSDSLLSALPPGSPVATFDPILQALESSVEGAGTAAAGSTVPAGSSLADQVASAQSQQIAALFGTSTVDSSINMLG